MVYAGVLAFSVGMYLMPVYDIIHNMRRRILDSPVQPTDESRIMKWVKSAFIFLTANAIIGRIVPLIPVLIFVNLVNSLQVVF